jgi:hypothetical protein
MPYQDVRGHEWPSSENTDDTPCLLCGTDFSDAGQYKCEDVVASRQVAVKADQGLVPLAYRDHLTFPWARIEGELRAMFEDDLSRLRAKAEQYGGADLDVMAAAISALIPDTGAEAIAPNQGMEAAIGFYLLGKVSRLTGAWNKGQDPSYDTWRDATLYSYMGRIVRKLGAWT